ncbi:MAG: polymer-forming cytoskeletal protein [Lachnospiraceae bacterium]|nr:polymer-forming cytoskeletal protein [Lachnospiraceae bacterium]
MSFFKDFTDDLTKAVNEMMPGEEATDSLEEEMLLDTEETEAEKTEEVEKVDFFNEDTTSADSEPEKEEKVEEKVTFHENTVTPPVSPFVSSPLKPVGAPTSTPSSHITSHKSATEENAVITEGMKIVGNLESTGSVEVRGVVEGDVSCKGKLVVTGVITGNTNSAEFFADNAKVQGEITAEGTVKIGAGSVIIGNVSATSSVVAGAVKGDIDVQGPVVVDTSAVVMGNIKSRSVQINNGAVIEGFCSQCYSDIDVQNIFG